MRPSSTTNTTRPFSTRIPTKGITGDWRSLLSQSISTGTAFREKTSFEVPHLREIIDRYPMRINPYYLGLIEKQGDPVYRQCVPDPAEIEDDRGYEDPLNEETLSPVPGLTHRYPDRVLFLVSNRCAMYCRFCNRKRKVGKPGVVTGATIREGLAYIRGHREVRDVLLSGGDPLLLSNKMLFEILNQLRAIPHVEIIRIGTRVPCSLPQRVTPQLTNILRSFHPLYINTHFNHPTEITPASSLACKRLAEAGIPLGCQTVLLKGVNDDPAVMGSLMKKLLSIRVRPYYLFQGDLARGTAHFWTPLEKGLEIMSALRGYTSGLCVPHFAIDLPGGGGKVPLLPGYLIDKGKDFLILKNYEGRIFHYPVIADD
ncbi:MAG: KamA family radical SAM protein [Deltaproteobacteria bacterium]|nr:KamA family radical SAM protein [Deltaproteobacteria bacterium]